MVASRYLLWVAPALHQDEANERVSVAVAALGLPLTRLETAETLLHQTRSQSPLIILLADSVVAGVARLDLIALLRRRKHLAHTPIVVLGAENLARHEAALASGADLYLSDTLPSQLTLAYLKKFLEREQADAGLREALSRLRQFEAAYHESERMKDDLTHMLVHDLKSPIASVMGLVDHALDIIQSSSDVYGLRELLSLARGESQHLLNLAANILDVRRMKEGSMPYYPAWIESISDLSAISLGDVNLSLRDRHVSTLVRPDAEQLYADSALMRRVLANLFANAVKHTQQGGHIDFRAWRDEQGYILSVRDDGEGIPEEDQKRIFNAFEQSRHTVHDRFDTGMGLTFCKLAVEKHGGKIWVESKVGRGSTFFFTIPLNVIAPPGSEDLLLT